jgi:hypothetical protein
MNYTIFKDLNNSEFPLALQTTIGANTYSLLFRKNERFDFYTLSILDSEEKELLNTKILYFDWILKSKLNEDLDPAKIQIVFLDERELQVDTSSKFHTKVDSSNFLVNVFPVILDVTSI